MQNSVMDAFDEGPELAWYHNMRALTGILNAILVLEFCREESSAVALEVCSSERMVNKGNRQLCCKRMPVFYVVFIYSRSKWF
jgi:hypothetical protein